MLFFKTFLRITDKFSILRLDSSKKMKKYQIKELIHYIFTLNNIRFCIYVIYFIFMIFYSIQFLENNITYKSNAVLQSFLTYLAFDNIIMLKKQIFFSPIEFLKKIIFSIIPNNDEQTENHN